ncbi:MAG: SpoIIE family protein phosphatase, partial [Thermoanaerobaculia bacterium]
LIDSGDTLVLYTDGIIEAANPDGEEFGTARLAEVVASNLDNELGALNRSIETALEEFVEGVPYTDDRTLLLLRKL